MLERYSEVEPGLWIGACPRGESPEFAQAVLNLFGVEPYTVRCDVYREERLLDLDVPDRALLDGLAQWVHDQRARGLSVLVHCEEGRNRSALVAALYLIRHRGIRSADAIELLRDKRGASVLYNGAFVRYLKSLDPPERVRIVDLGPACEPRFRTCLDDSEEFAGQHQTQRAAELWIEAVTRANGYPTPVVTYEQASAPQLLQWTKPAP